MRLQIKTPDGMIYETDSDVEMIAFCGGFCAALMCFGIWKDGTQHIGCMERPIRDYIDFMKSQLPKNETKTH